MCLSGVGLVGRAFLCSLAASTNAPGTVCLFGTNNDLCDCADKWIGDITQ